MISKIQSTNSNINFQSKVHIDLGAGYYLNKYSKLSGSKPFAEQIKELINNKNRDIVVISRQMDTYTDGISLTVLTEDGCEGKHRFYHAHPGYRGEKINGLHFSLIDLYDKAKSKLEAPLNDNNPFKIFDI